MPQSSFLGPVILIYVNDLLEGMDIYLNTFADDTEIIREVIKSEEDFIILQGYVNTPKLFLNMVDEIQPEQM